MRSKQIGQTEHHAATGLVPDRDHPDSNSNERSNIATIVHGKAEQHSLNINCVAKADGIVVRYSLVNNPGS